MGKATILPSKDLNLAPGKYRIRIEKEQTRTESEFKRIDSEIKTLGDNIPSLFTEYENSRTSYHNAKNDLDEVLLQAKGSPEEDYSAKVKSATNAVTAAQLEMGNKKTRYNNARLKESSLQSERVYLENKIGDEDIRIVWCADCQRDLEGTVATVEIPNTEQEIMIRPGGVDGSGSVYSATRDGQLKSIIAMSPAETAWNYIMLPGWQRYRPLYRLGKITERSPNSSKCNVLLDAYSTAQGLATDEERRLTNVEMIYKGRDDGGPYEVGDRVLISFYNQNREAPQVIGFEQDPCTTTTSTFSTTTTSSNSSTSSSLSTTTSSTGILTVWFDVLVTQLDITFTPEQVIGGPAVGGPYVYIQSKNGISMWGWNYHISPVDPSMVRLEAITSMIDPDGYWLLGFASSHFPGVNTQWPFRHGSEQWQDVDLIPPYNSRTFDLAYWDLTVLSNINEDLRITHSIEAKRRYVKSNLQVDITHSYYINMDSNSCKTLWSPSFLFVATPPGFPPASKCCVSYPIGSTMSDDDLGISPMLYHPSYAVFTDFGGLSDVSVYGVIVSGSETKTVAAPISGRTYTLTIENTTTLTKIDYTSCYCSGEFPECKLCDSPIEVPYLSARYEPYAIIQISSVTPHIP